MSTEGFSPFFGALDVDFSSAAEFRQRHVLKATYISNLTRGGRRGP